MCNCNGGTVDYVCPYSKKISFALDKVVFPLIQKQYAGKVKVIFRNQVQPWHASSTLVHEAGLAVSDHLGGDSSSLVLRIVTVVDRA